MDRKELVKIAKKKVEEKKKFYSHLNGFCIVTFTLFLINYFATPETWWFFFPIIGWAMALIGHYLNVFGVPSFRSESWEEEQFEVEMDKLERRQLLDYQKNEILDLSSDQFELKKVEKKRLNEER